MNVDKKLIHAFVLPIFLGTIVCFPLCTLAQYPQITLPKPGVMVALSSPFEPPMIRGLRIDPKDPLSFHMIVDQGQENIHGEKLKEEGLRMARYFMAAVAVPQKDIWVNLSPYEAQRIVPESLGHTEMGSDMLAQDYLLKQITASLIYPEGKIGKEFWKEVYEKNHGHAHKNSTVDMRFFNKVWIVADRAEVYEKVHGPSGAPYWTAVVSGSHLKVMLAQDYEARQRNMSGSNAGGLAARPLAETIPSGTDGMIRSVILPAIEKEVNTGKNFTKLRQIFNAIILAIWYKQRLKQSLFTQAYADRSRIGGIKRVGLDVPQEIYQRYLTAYKKGVFNFIREEKEGEVSIPRKYFSGGISGEVPLRIVPKETLAPRYQNGFPKDRNVDFAMKITFSDGWFGDSGIQEIYPDEFKALEAARRVADVAGLFLLPDIYMRAINVARPDFFDPTYRLRVEVKPDQREDRVLCTFGFENKGEHFEYKVTVLKRWLEGKNYRDLIKAVKPTAEYFVRDMEVFDSNRLTQDKYPRWTPFTTNNHQADWRESVELYKTLRAVDWMVSNNKLSATSSMDDGKVRLSFGRDPMVFVVERGEYPYSIKRLTVVPNRNNPKMAFQVTLYESWDIESPNPGAFLIKKLLRKLYEYILIRFEEQKKDLLLEILPMDDHDPFLEKYPGFLKLLAQVKKTFPYYSRGGISVETLGNHDPMVPLRVSAEHVQDIEIIMAVLFQRRGVIREVPVEGRTGIYLGMYPHVSPQQDDLLRKIADVARMDIVFIGRTGGLIRLFEILNG